MIRELGDAGTADRNKKSAQRIVGFVYGCGGLLLGLLLFRRLLYIGFLLLGLFKRGLRLLLGLGLLLCLNRRCGLRGLVARFRRAGRRLTLRLCGWSSGRFLDGCRFGRIV
jgi:hypothetical protein